MTTWPVAFHHQGSSLSRMRRLLLPASFAFVVSGCDTFARADALQQQTAAVEAAVAERFGAKPTIRWSIINGAFVSMDVFLPRDAVAEYSVSELYDSVAAVLDSELGEMPGILTVGVVAESGYEPE
jgi:hypothetical protein